jgi:hypothetical protein
MFKREAAYDTQILDWFWAKRTPAVDIDKNPKVAFLAGRVCGGLGGLHCLPPGVGRQRFGKPYRTLALSLPIDLEREGRAERRPLSVRLMALLFRAGRPSERSERKAEARLLTR